MMEIITGLVTDVRTVLASIALILATTSFISGLQLVRSRSRIERKIHRFNGAISISIYTILMVWYFVVNGIALWPTTMWLSGFSLICAKLWMVRKRGKAFKYVSWLGATLLLIWLYLVYVHIPV